MTITLNRCVITKHPQIKLGLAEFSAPINNQKIKEQQRDAAKLLFAEINSDGALPDTWYRAPSGQPHFHHSQWRISISHSGHFVAVVLSLNADIGVDIQIERANKLKEYASYLSWPEDQLFRRWCLYEAIYKCKQKPPADLAKAIARVPIPSEPRLFPCLDCWGLCWSPLQGVSASLVGSEASLLAPFSDTLNGTLEQ